MKGSHLFTYKKVLWTHSPGFLWAGSWYWEAQWRGSEKLPDCATRLQHWPETWRGQLEWVTTQPWDWSVQSMWPGLAAAGGGTRRRFRTELVGTPHHVLHTDMFVRWNIGGVSSESQVFKNNKTKFLYFSGYISWFWGKILLGISSRLASTSTMKLRLLLPFVAISQPPLAFTTKLPLSLSPFFNNASTSQIAR